MGEVVDLDWEQKEQNGYPFRVILVNRFGEIAKPIPVTERDRQADTCH